MPVFEGDDLRRLASEIALCRKFLLQSRSYRYGGVIFKNRLQDFVSWGKFLARRLDVVNTKF